MESEGIEGISEFDVFPVELQCQRAPNEGRVSDGKRDAIAQVSNLLGDLNFADKRNLSIDFDDDREIVQVDGDVNLHATAHEQGNNLAATSPQWDQ